jgi:LPS export ABC transporter protein LptC
VLYQKGLPYWYIWSERGEVDDKSKTYFLLGKTYFKRYNTKGELQLNVLTADVTYLPETAVAKTDAKTTIYSTLGRTDTVGMQVWLNEKKLKLNQKVRGRYEFNHKK